MMAAAAMGDKALPIDTVCGHDECVGEGDEGWQEEKTTACTNNSEKCEKCEKPEMLISIRNSRP